MYEFVALNPSENAPLLQYDGVYGAAIVNNVCVKKQ